MPKKILIVEDEANIRELLRLYLEREGYDVQILEFIDMEHTPKNILIRAVKKPVSEEKRERAKAEAERLCRTFGIHQTLMQLVLTEERSHS